MDRIEKLPLGETGNADTHSAFLTLCSSAATPFKLASHPNTMNLICPTFLMQCRDDGGTGFFGGGVDEGESLKAGALREFYEETGFRFQHPVELISSYLCTNAAGKTRSSHLFAAEVSFEFLLDMVVQITSHMRREFNETHGTKLVATYIKPGSDRGMPYLMRTPMPPSAGEHVLDLIGHYKFMKPEEQVFLRDVFDTRLPTPVYRP